MPMADFLFLKSDGKKRKSAFGLRLTAVGRTRWFRFNQAS
jgi:hypothetical protein